MILNRAMAPRNEVRQTITLENPEDWVQGVTRGTGRQGAMKISAVNACVECLCNSMSKLPVFVMNAKTKEHVEHRLLRLLSVRPKEAMTPAVYKKLVEANRLMGGNGYVLIMRNPNTSRVEELIPLHYNYVAPWLDETGKLWYLVTNPGTGELRKLGNFDMLHYKAYTEDGINGISVLSRAQEVIDTSKAAQKYENGFYTRNARPVGILKTDDHMDKSAKDKIREEWNKIHEGVDNAFRIAVLDLGIDYKQISMSNKDTQFVESKAVSVEDIARFFGVPLYKINAGKQTYNSNEQNGIEYVVGTLHPIVTQYEEEDTYKLLFEKEQKQGLEIRRNMMAELRGDFTSRGAWYRTMREIGAYSVDDIMDLEDRPAVPGGKSRYASLNYVPLELFEELSINRNRAGKGG